MSEKKQIVRAAGIIGAFTLMSRIMGYVRDMVMAGFFGSGLITDAFIAAFRLPNLLRRLFAEGSLVVSFVPVFTDYLTNNGEEEAFELAGSAFRVLSIILVVLSIAGVMCAPYIIQVLAPGFDVPEKYELAVQLTRIVFPYAFFICLVALSMGILNALGHFAAPALAPVFLNVFMIAAMAIAGYCTDDPVKQVNALAWGVLAGGSAQLGLQIPFLIKKGFRFWKRTVFFHPGLKKVGKMMLPSVLGAGVYQINILAGTIIASLLVEGSISWLYYADRIFQFPLGLFAISMGTAILPSLSRQAAQNDLAGLKNTFSYGLRLIFFISLPAAAGLIVIREPIVSLLFERWAFTHTDVIHTADALLYYAAGLCFVAAVRVTAPVFYARQDAKTPVIIAVIAIVANIVLSIVLMGPLKHCGLALATTLASGINFVLLFIIVRVKMGNIGGLHILFSVIRSAFCSIVMAYSVHHLALYIIPAYNTQSWIKTGGAVIACITTGGIVYVLMALIVRSPELKSAASMFKRG